jgi:hypothetical protein
MILEFNNPVNRESANHKNYFLISQDHKPGKIKSIEVNDRRVILKLKEHMVNLNQFDLKILNLKDMYGHIIDQPQYAELYQFRELFVQDYHCRPQGESNCYLQNTPLIQNCIIKKQSDAKYWMNTPLQEFDK